MPRVTRNSSGLRTQPQEQQQQQQQQVSGDAGAAAAASAVAAAGDAPLQQLDAVRAQLASLLLRSDDALAALQASGSGAARQRTLNDRAWRVLTEAVCSRWGALFSESETSAVTKMLTERAGALWRACPGLVRDVLAGRTLPVTEAQRTGIHRFLCNPTPPNERPLAALSMRNLLQVAWHRILCLDLAQAEAMRGSDLYRDVAHYARLAAKTTTAEHVRMRETCVPRSPMALRQMQAVAARYMPNSVANGGSSPILSDMHNIFCLRFSEDGSTLLAASQDARVHVLSGPDWKLTEQFECASVGWSILDADMSRDKKRVLYTTWSPAVHIVDLASGRQSSVAVGSSRVGLFAGRFAHDDRRVLLGGNDGVCRVVDLERRTETHRLLGHGLDVNSACWLNEHQPSMCLSASDDACGMLWDLRADTAPVAKFIGHMDGLTCIAPRHDGRYVVTNSKDQTMKLWDLRRLASASTPSLPSTNVGWDYRWQSPPWMLRLASPAYDDSVMTFRGHIVQRTLIRCGFSPERTTGGAFAYTGSATGSVFVFDLLTGEVVQRFDAHHALVRECSWHPWQPVIASAGWDGVVQLLTYSPDGAEPYTAANEARLPLTAALANANVDVAGGMFRGLPGRWPRGVPANDFDDDDGGGDDDEGDDDDDGGGDDDVGDDDGDDDDNDDDSGNDDDDDNDDDDAQREADSSGEDDGGAQYARLE